MADRSDGLLSDPYASSSSPSLMPPTGAASAPAAASGWSASKLPPQVPVMPDYLFEVEERRSAGERLQYHVGCAYLLGLAVGGTAGSIQGMKASAGERRSIRINSVLNTAGRLGPGLANTVGCLAMMTSIFESIAYNARGTDDMLNPAGAAALTGTLYKITSGPKQALAAGVGLGAIAAAVSFATKQISSRGLLKNIL